VALTSGNADFAYARLNVPGGLHSLYNSQWGDEHFSEPTLSDISRNVDVVRAKFVPEKTLWFWECARLTEWQAAKPNWNLRILEGKAKNGRYNKMASRSLTETPRESRVGPKRDSKAGMNRPGITGAIQFDWTRNLGLASIPCDACRDEARASSQKHAAQAH
jgi:hypothetical protein